MGGWGSGQSPAPPGTDPCSTRQTELSSECPAVSPAVEKHTIYVRGRQVEPRCQAGERVGQRVGWRRCRKWRRGALWQRELGCGEGKRTEDGRVWQEGSFGLFLARRVSKDRCVCVGNFDKGESVSTPLVLCG